MKKPLKVFLFLSLSSILLSACGVSKTSSGTSRPVQESAPTVGQVSDKDTAKDSTGGIKPSTTTNVATEKPASTETRPSVAKTTTKDSEIAKEKQIEVDAKTNKHALATVFEASHTPLYLYTLPGYEVSEAKSGNEIQVASKNQSIKMTIAPIEKGMNLEEAKKRSMEGMKKVSQNVKEITTLKSDKFYENATVYYASNQKEIEAVYMLTIDGFPIKVTIDRPVKTDAILPYLQAMMKTVAIKAQ